MRRLFTFIVAVLLTAGVFAQSPEKMSYQAVIRDASDILISDTQIGMQISILQGSASGTAVYVETQTPTTNANGLVSIEIGTGTTSDDFSVIDWANGLYFIQTETDPAGGTNYTITGTSQLLSVPYALHAKTAESVTGTITETDPVFSAWDKSTGISITESQVSNLGNYLDTETDPAFTTNFDFTGAASGDLLQFDGTKWKKVTPNYISDYTVTESDVTTHQGALTVTESQISDLQSYLTTETDPVFSAWDKSNGILITESQISDLRTYLTSESDPVYTAKFDLTSVADGDLLKYNNTTGKFEKFTPGYAAGSHSHIDATTSANGFMSSIDKTKLDGIVEGAEVNVNADWNATTGDAQIMNKPANATTTTDGFMSKEDKARVDGIPNGTQAGEMQYWNGSEWITVAPGYDGATLTLVDGVPTWKYELQAGEVKNPTTGKVWMDRNLGSTQIATSSTDAASYGDLYQWGRAADGHEKRNSPTTSTLSSSDSPGHGEFITSDSSPYDWRSPQNDNLWQGLSGTNNPCPSGYRLPTEAEWEAERASWDTSDGAGAFASTLKLPLAGARAGTTGSLYNVGNDGFYWSSTVDGIYSTRLYIRSSQSFMFSYYRASGYSVRCIKD